MGIGSSGRCLQCGEMLRGWGGVEKRWGSSDGGEVVGS